MPLGLKSQVNGKRHNFGEANKSVSFLSNHEGKELQRESDRKLGNCSYSKRPRIDQSESHPRNARVDDANRVDDASTILQKNADLIRTTSADKTRMIKSKRGLDGKRIDRKNFRSGTKSRYDTFTSKAGFPGMDSTCGGHNLLGMLSLKSDLSDVTKHMDDLRLSELLDGSYRYSIINAEKGKKPPITSENMFASVRKAFFNLPQNCSTDSNSNIKAAQVLIKASSSSNTSVTCQNDKDANQSSSTAKYPSLDDASLHPPKEVLKHLVLPPAHDLDTLLLDLSLPSSKSTLLKKTCHGASLPPFSWSSSHTGVCKTTVDTGKQISTKNTCQGRWIRIDNTILAGDNRDCFSDWERLTFHNIEDPLQKNVLQDVGSSSIVFPISTSIEGNTRDNTVLEKESCSSVSHTFKRLSLMEQTNCSHIGLECDTKDSSLFRTCVSDASLNSQGKDSDLQDQVRPTSQFNNPEFAKKDLNSLNKHGCSPVCCLYPCKDADREYERSSWNSSTLEMSKPDYSLCEMHAAEVLVGMTRCYSTLRNRNEDGGRTKWPKTSWQKTSKTQKLVSPMEKSGSLVFKTKHQDLIRTVGLPYWEKPGEKKNDSSYMGTAGRVPMKYSGRIESGVFPCKLEKDLPASARSLHNVTVRSITSLARVENGYENQQKLRKTTLGTYIKDWSRGRNK